MDFNFTPNLTSSPMAQEDYAVDELMTVLPEGCIDALEKMWRDDEKRQYALACADLQKLRRINDIVDKTLKPETAMGQSIAKIPTWLYMMWGERIGFDALHAELPQFIRDTPELQRPNLPKHSRFAIDGFKQETPTDAIVDGNGRAA